MVQAVHDSLELVTAPTKLALSIEAAAAHLRINAPEDDQQVRDSIQAAIDKIQDQTSRQLITATYDLRLDCFPNEIELRKPPIQSVTSITYNDTAGDPQTLSASLYEVDVKSEPGRIIPAYGTYWPTTRGQHNDVTVRFVCGYGNGPEDIPSRAKHLLRLLTEQDYYGSFDNLALQRAIDSLMWALDWGGM